MKYAALLDASGDVENVITCPADRDPVAHVAALGLAGEWADAGEGLPTAGIGWHHHAGGFYPHWVQIAGAEAGPEEAESGYPEGAEVWHNGQAWLSTVAFNVWEPGVFGWVVI